MGILAADVGKVQEALPFFKIALVANPNTAQFWLSYIDALIKLEKWIDAKAVLEQAKSKGANGTEFDKLEQSLKDVGQERLEASKIGAKALPQQQNVLDSLQLGQAISLAKKKCKDSCPEEAERIYQDILARFPKNKRAIDGLQGLTSRPVGKASKAKDLPQHQLQALMALYEKGQLTLVIEHAEALTKQYPKACDVWNLMGASAAQIGQLDQAILAFKRVLAIKPDYAQAYVNIGNALKEQGKMEEALASYNKALSLKPDYADAARNLVLLPINSIDGQTISELSKKFSSICSNIDDQSQKLFFEANLLSHKGEYDKAFRIFVDANAEKLKKNRSSMGSEQKQSNAAIKRISRWSVKPQSEQNSSIKKLFILGPSRSGKSTLETFLIGSPNVYPMFESYNFEAILKSELSTEETKKLSMRDLFYHDENSLIKLGYNVVTSTNPDTIFQIDRLIDALSNSFCIFVRRNRIDIAADIFIREYTRGHFYSHDHSTILKYLDTYEAIWEIIKQKVPHLTLEISFEDMLGNPLETIKKISQMTGASFEVSNPPNRSMTNLSSPFREHYASHFMAP